MGRAPTSRLEQPLYKTVWNFLKKLKMKLLFDLAIPLLRLFTKNPETPILKNLCIPVFIDVDPGQQDPCVVVAMDKFTWTTESCGGKGTARPLSQGKSSQTLALTGFYWV